MEREGWPLDGGKAIILSPRREMGPGFNFAMELKHSSTATRKGVKGLNSKQSETANDRPLRLLAQNDVDFFFPCDHLLFTFRDSAH